MTLSDLIGHLLTILAVVGATYFSHRQLKAQLDRYKTEDTTAKEFKMERHRESLRKSTQPLYADLGTLMHLTIKQGDDIGPIIDHIRIMDERRHRGTYDMPDAPAVIQNEWVNTVDMFDQLRLAMTNDPWKHHWQDRSFRSFLLMTVLHRPANTLQANLTVIRQQ